MVNGLTRNMTPKAEVSVWKNAVNSENMICIRFVVKNWQITLDFLYLSRPHYRIYHYEWMKLHDREKLGSADDKLHSNIWLMTKISW